MDKIGKIYIVLIVILLVLFVFIEYTKPKEVSWFPSFDKNHTIPYGTKVLHEEMKFIFKDRFEDVLKPPYSFLNKNDVKGTYFFVNETIAFGKEEMNTLLNWVAEGNQLFVASSSYDKEFLDTLGLGRDYLAHYETLKPSYELSLSNEALKNKKSAVFDRSVSVYFFTDKDSVSTNATRVGEIKLKGKTKAYVNVIEQSFGKGQIILSLFPQSFTNYFMLSSTNHEYVSGLLSYLSKSDKVFFDNYYKTGATFYSSPMYVFLTNNSLKWAYYVVLIAALFYIIFEGRRKQRSIPVITPLRNQTLDFVRTIANMYYEKKDHRDIAMYKINHFLAFVRRQQAMQLDEFNEFQLKAIAERNDKPYETTKKLFAYIKMLQNKQSVTKEELINLNRMIEDFKK
jgi:hypothetical protein